MIVWNIDADDDFFLGEDKILGCTIYQQNKRTVQNITNWTLSWSLKQALTDTVALLTKTTSTGITITSATAGTVTIPILDTDTDNLEPGTYVHELKRTNDNEETVLSQGRCVVKRGVHRS